MTNYPVYLYRDSTIQYGPDIYNGENFLDMEMNEEYKEHPGGLRRVYKVTNNAPGKEKGKSYYMISPYEEENAIEARIKDKIKSKTSVGGIKVAAKQMTALGDDYQDLFSVKAMSGWLNKKNATELRNKLSKNQKAKSGKLYNKVSVNKDTNFQS